MHVTETKAIHWIRLHRNPPSHCCQNLQSSGATRRPSPLFFYSLAFRLYHFYRLAVTHYIFLWSIGGRASSNYGIGVPNVSPRLERPEEPAGRTKRFRPGEQKPVTEVPGSLPLELCRDQQIGCPPLFFLLQFRCSAVHCPAVRVFFIRCSAATASVGARGQFRLGQCLLLRRSPT